MDRLRHAHLWRALLLTVLLRAAGAAAEPSIAFSTSGGEAWTFAKRIEVIVPPSHCHEVAISSPRGTRIARVEAGKASASVPLAPGDNRVEAQCHDGGLPQGPAVEQGWRVRLINAPKAQIAASLADDSIALDAGASEPAPVAPATIVRYQWQARPGNPAPLTGLPGQGKRLVLTKPARDGEYRVTVRVSDVLGRSDESTVLFRVRHGSLDPTDPARDHAAWIDKAVIYGVVPRLFGAHGLADVTAQLDRLAALGIDALWLSPITASAPGDFGYAVTDHFRVDDRLGSAADLHELIEAAHARGLRVILDFVANHLSDQHPYFVDAATNARASPYYEFFARTAAGDPAHYFDWRNLENLNYRNPEVQRLIIEAFSYWVREFDVDGFRVDAAWGVRERVPEFWPQWRAELRRLKPDLLLLAEAPAEDRYYARHGFDAAYDWTDRLGEWAWQEAFADASHTASRLHARLAAAASDIAVFRFLDNNDSGARFISRFGPLRMRLGAALLFTLPGLPSLYTGEEMGAEYEPYERTDPISWTDPQQLDAWFARLIALRHAYPALRSHALRVLDLASPDPMLAYLRPAETAGGKTILVLLNYGSAAQCLKLPPQAAAALGSGALTDLLTGEEVDLGAAECDVSVPGGAARILTRAD